MNKKMIASKVTSRALPPVHDLLLGAPTQNQAGPRQRIAPQSTPPIPDNKSIKTIAPRAGTPRRAISFGHPKEPKMQHHSNPEKPASMNAPFVDTRVKQAARALRHSVSALALALTLGLGSALTAQIAAAQDAVEAGESLIKAGDTAITGFSGLKFPEGGLPPGIDPLDESFINPDQPSLRIYRTDNMGAAPSGQMVNLPEILKVNAAEIGQVFGLAFDDGDRGEGAPQAPNLYVTSSVLHGLQIVGPDTDDDGRPERLKQGQPDAEFMDGQFGTKNGGTPGAIWKIDGLTGEVSLFANVMLDDTENSGPGLGNIAFDKRTRQLFVSDLDTGMIHRFDMDGNDQGTFDHGTTGRAAAELDQAPHDAANRMDIKAESFKADDPETWGFADEKRLVYGLQPHGDRLYYYAADGDMIMSVGIADDGSFGEAQWEFNLNQTDAKPVTDIAFDRRGVIYLSMRGAVLNPYDYSVFAEPAASEVRR